jgi:cell wall-associated NlpC family hydrolase
LLVGRDSRKTTGRVELCVAVAAACAAVLLVASAASAEPSVDEKRRQAEAILAQVQELDAEVGAAAERFNGANYKLGLLGDRLRETRADLKRSRSMLRSARQAAGGHLVDLYVNGSGPSVIEIVLGARSIGEAIDAVDAQERILDQDAQIARALRQLSVRTTKRARELAAAQGTQRRLVSQLAAERDAIAAKLSEREELLRSIQAEVQRLEAEERARQAELRRRAEAELVRQRALAAAQARRASDNPSAAQEATEPPPLTAAPAADAPVEAAPAVPIPEPAPAPAPPADATRGAQVVAIAMRYLGVPYKWGGASPSTGFDCSGFTMYVFAQIGVSLPHYAAAQYGMGRAVSKSELQPGDLVFFTGLGHMGMYIGGGNFIHSPRTGDVVKISSLSEPYRVANWVGARRVL